MRTSGVSFVTACLALGLATPCLAVRGRDGSRLVRLTRPSVGEDASGMRNLTVLGSRVFFTSGYFAWAGNGHQVLRWGLWKTNGKPKGTGRVRAVGFPGDPFQLYEFAAAGGRLFFTRDSSLAEGERELWVTDGTTRGTLRLAGLLAENLTDVNGTLFFSTRENGANTLWKSDGTPEGTVHVAEITSTIDGLYAPTRFVMVGERLFFFADDGTHTFTLHSSDGVAPVTSRLAALTAVSSYYDNLVDLNGTALLTDGGRVLRSDGTPGGTELVADLTPGAISAAIGVGTTAFLVVATVTNFALWSTDGTAGNTRLVADGYPGHRFAPLGQLDGILYLTSFAIDGSSAPAIWRSDGTNAGTTLLTTLPPGSGFTSVPDAVVGGLLFFLVDLVDKRELWRTDGTAAGTLPVTSTTQKQFVLPDNLLAAGDILYFTTMAPAPFGSGHALWALRPPK